MFQCWHGMESFTWGQIKKYKYLKCYASVATDRHLQARLSSCRRNNKSAAFLYFSNSMYCRYDRSLRIAESMCAANLLVSVTCCADGGRFILLYMISRFTSWISSRIAFLDSLSWTCRSKEGCGMLKIILVCPSSTRGTSSIEMSFRSIVRPSASLPQKPLFS
jgi:hypothetical protein